MRIWLFLLIATLLFNVIQANAEEVFYTNNHDRYYHADPDCDRPPLDDFGIPVYAETYERAIYKKYEISEKAAAEFQKTACPVCVKDFEPVYLGEHMTQWTFDAAQPWEFVDGDFLRFTIEDAAFKAEVSQTHSVFSDYFEEYAEYKTGIVKRKHDYPSCFAGIYRNVQGSYTYQIVDPTDEILAAFEKMFGGGAWIVPAKYGYNEMDETKDLVFNTLDEWCKNHPDVDARPVYASVENLRNRVAIGINGEDWQQAAAAMEDIAPIYVHFSWHEHYETGHG